MSFGVSSRGRSVEVTLVKVLPECGLYKCVWTEQVVCCVLTGWRDEKWGVSSYINPLSYTLCADA